MAEGRTKLTNSGMVRRGKLPSGAKYVSHRTRNKYEDTETWSTAKKPGLAVRTEGYKSDAGGKNDKSRTTLVGNREIDTTGGNARTRAASLKPKKRSR